MNVHDKFRSPCPHCGKKYSDLRQHIRVVHEGAKVLLQDYKKYYTQKFIDILHFSPFRMSVHTVKEDILTCPNISTKCT